MFARRKKNKIKQKGEKAFVESIKEKIKATQDQIDTLEKWCVELIFDIFHVPKKFWYNEIESYQAIKQLPENKDISRETVEKADKIFQTYTGKIEILRKKIEFYQAALTRIQNLKQKQKQLKTSQKDKNFSKIFEKHLQRIQNNNFESLEDIYVTNQNLVQEAQNIENEQEFIALYKQAEEQLIQYTDSPDITDYKVLEKELNKLIKTIKKTEQ